MRELHQAIDDWHLIMDDTKGENISLEKERVAFDKWNVFRGTLTELDATL